MIKNLTIEKFCQILDGLPLDFKIELQGKVLSKILMNGKTAWQIDDRVLLNPILFAFKKEIFDAIESKGYSLRNLYFGWVALPKKKLQMLYYKQRKSTGEIAKEYGTTRQSIMKIMKRHGFIRRTRSEARIEAIKRGKFEKLSYEDIDENFFCEWWQEMAWALGLLFTDGHIRGNLVQFTSVDIELLEKVRKLFQSSRQIEKRTQSYDKSKHIYAFTFSHPRIAEDLRKLGLHERKSLNMIFPDVPEEYLRHFIRGCWDGDGSVYIYEGKLRGSYVCGSLKFIERLVQELYKVGIYKRTLPKDKTESDKMWLEYPDGRFPLTIHKSKRSKSYEIKIDSRENLEKMFNYFYDRVDDSMYLERKFEIFAKGLGVLTAGLQEV